VEKIHRYLVGALAIAIILGLARALEIYAIGRVHNAVSRFNLKRILRLAAGLVALFIVVSVLFVNWYAAVVSLGLISLILGFALQTPISSFIGWVYILTRAPYRVGDRIEIGDARGDVIDVGYLDTTLWEIGGRHLSTDHPSGRLIKFPNTNVFNTPVFNYSWPLFPYIWNEIKFQIAYESDLEFVASTMQKIAENDLGPSMLEKVKVYRDLLARTPVGHLDVEERPVVLFRVSENTWLEAIVRYLVHPKEAGRVKTRLTRKLLTELNSAPDRVLFPKSNLR
jgi:small-conductance mechanosensitive channel